MVAVCPSCHDAIHNGPLEVNDDTVRRGKGIEREQVHHDHVYVEPGGSPKLLLGTIAVTGEGGVTVFELGPSTKLEFFAQSLLAAEAVVTFGPIPSERNHGTVVKGLQFVAWFLSDIYRP